MSSKDSKGQPPTSYGVKYEPWIVPIVCLSPLLTVGIAVWMVVIKNWLSFGICLGLSVFVLALYWAVFPRRLEVDVAARSLRVVAGAPFVWSFDMGKFRSVKHCPDLCETLGRPAIKFAPSISHRVVIERDSFLDLFVAPMDVEAFVYDVRKAMQTPAPLDSDNLSKGAFAFSKTLPEG